jgi:hypothetical protein
MRTSGLLAACLLTLLNGRAFAASTPATIVARFFPPALTTTAAGPVPAQDRKSTYLTGDLNHDGSSLIVAAYWNGVSAAVSVLSPAGDGAQLAAAVPPAMTGSSAALELLDFDRDGRPEIVVTVDQVRGLPTTWIYKWTGSALSLVGPVRDAGTAEVMSDLADATFLDVDGNATISVIDRHAGVSCSDAGDGDAHEEYRLFRYENGDLRAAAASVEYFETFTRAKGAPVTQTATFAISGDPKGLQLVVVNGDAHGGHRAASASVAINGNVVVGPESFNEKTATIRVSAPFTTGQNTAAVKVAGAPESQVSVLVIRQ